MVRVINSARLKLKVQILKFEIANFMCNCYFLLYLRLGGVIILFMFLFRSNQGVRINPDGPSRTGGAVKLDFSSLAILSPFAGGASSLGQVNIRQFIKLQILKC